LDLYETSKPPKSRKHKIVNFVPAVFASSGEQWLIDFQKRG